MASQLKKNKNQFIRKGIVSSAVINTFKDVNIVGVSAIQSGVERIQIDTPDVNSGVHSGVERDPVDTTNANSGEIIGNLRSIQKCAEGVNLFALSVRPTTKSCTEVGGRSGMPEENFDPGGTMHAPTMYNQSSEYMPDLHLESSSKPSTGSNSQSTIKNYASGIFGENQSAENPKTTEDLPFTTSAAQRSRYSEPHGHPHEQHTDTYVSQLIHQQMLNQGNSPPPAGLQTSDHMDYSHAPPLPKTPPPELLAKPLRMAKNKTWCQDSFPTQNKGVNLRSSALKKHHSSREQKEASHQYSNNLDDNEEDKDISWEYPGERKLLGHQMMASDIQYPNFKEYSQMHYGGEGIRDDTKQGDQSSKAGQMFGWQYGEQTGRMPGGHPGEPMQQMQGVLYKENMGNMHPSGRDSGYTPSWQEEYSGHWQDGQHAKGPSMHSKEYFGPLPTRHHAGTMGPVPKRHHTGTSGQMPYQLNEGSMQQMHGGSVGQTHGELHGGSMRQMYGGFHGGSVGQMHGGSVGQKHGELHGGSMGQMYGGFHGGSVEQMHPNAQSEVMYPCGQGSPGEFQPDDMGESWDFPRETWQGDGQGNASYSQGASNFPGPSNYMTDRELASEQLDQRMNNPWFQKVVQNMKELVEREGLIVKDVFPDGNCLFTTVIDQLRVRGNFNFTPSTLRAAAVAFLRENPKQHDGTHLEQFLMNESWDHYLNRICKDGEWGEHIILGAVSEVLKCRIIVLGGMSGNSRTVVQPQHMSDEEEKRLQKEKREANGSKTVKDGSLTETEGTGAESQPMQTGTASSTSKADANTKSTDTSHRKDKTDSLSKQNKEKKDEELQIGEDLYIGLLGEMHYVSLRKKDWEERLNEKLRARIKKRKAKQRQEAGQENDSTSDDDLCLPEDPLLLLSTDIVVDPASGVHLPHLDFIVKHINESTYLHKTKLCPHSFDTWHVHCPDYKKQIVGFQIAELEQLPSVQLPHVHSLFENKHSQENCRNCLRCSVKKSATIVKYFTPDDTKVVFREKEMVGANKDDVSLKTKECGQGYVKLSPTDPSLWKGQLLPDETGQLYLKHMQVDSIRIEPGSEIPCLISFYCSWPIQAKQWFERKRQSNWIPSHVAKIISKDTCRIIPTSHKKSQNSLMEWKYSFDMAEDKMIQCCLTPSYETGFYAFKFLVNTVMKESSEDFRDVLRHTFFHACDNIGEELWGRKPASCVLYILTDLLHKLKSGFVPHYFMTSVNLIKEFSVEMVTSFVDKIKLLRCNPLVCTYFLLDNINLTYTEISKIFDVAVEDSKKLTLHGDIRRTKCEFLIPESIRQICFLVSNQMYEKAVRECFAAFEVMTSVENGISFTDLVQQILIELPLVCKWCFAFFLDRYQGMSLLRFVCDSIPSESLVHIFGPGIVRHLGELSVPSVLLCPKYIIDFVERATYILSLLGLHLSVVVALNFFLMSIYDQDTGIYTFKNQSLQTIQIVEHSHDSCSCHKLPPQQANLMRIALLYQRFFYACWHTKRMNICYPFVQKFRRVCENLHSEHYTSILHGILRCYEKTDDL